MKTEDVLKKLSLKEKIALCSGEDFWHTKELSKHGIPAMMMCDGPHGLRCQKKSNDMLGINESEPATCFPTAVTTACTWNTELLGEIGNAIAEETKALEVGVVLGPGANIKRDPLCGRNFEYFSEDPYLAGELAASFIESVQKTGIGTSLKHFALNNQEYKRFNGDSQVDERTMREIYLSAFEKAVKKGKPSTVMCGYNKLNGTHCSDHKELLTDILRTDWGYEGLVVTDWGAMFDRMNSFEAGCDLNMPGGSSYMEKKALKAVKKGDLSEEYVDKSAMRVLRMMEKAHDVLKDAAPFDEEAHHLLAKRAAAEGAVLLKNDSGILPVAEGTTVALIGKMAELPRYQGAGSSHINPTRLSRAKDFIKHAVYADGYDEKGNTDDSYINEAVNASKSAEVAVVFAGLPDTYESEGFDRDDMKMPKGHLDLIAAVAQANPNTVVVLCSGSVVECPWADSVKAVLYMGLSGQAGGEAAADLLCGKVNPSGKLAESWPFVYEDCATAEYWRGIKNPQYREGIYVGYRYYDKAKKAVRWPFGYGLSYTSFEYSNLSAEGYTVSADITNKGKCGGAEVVQLYVAPPKNGIHRPCKELKGFAKIYLEPGETKRVSFTLDERSFALWDNGWKTPGGKYRVLIGRSVSDTPLSAVVNVEGAAIEAPKWQSGSWYETMDGAPSKEDFVKLYGKEPVSDENPKKGEFTKDNTVIEMKDQSFVMRLLYKGIEKTMIKKFGGKKNCDTPEFRMFMSSSIDSPLRNMQILTATKDKIFDGLLDMANGRFFKGLFRMMGRNK